MSEIQTLDQRFTESTAVERTESGSPRNYLWSRLRRLRGGRRESNRVERIHYPNYVAYSTITIPRKFAGDRVEKLLAGIDGLTARAGAVDVDLPEQEARSEDAERVIEPTVTQETAKEEWRE